MSAWARGALAVGVAGLVASVLRLAVRGRAEEPLRPGAWRELSGPELT